MAEDYGWEGTNDEALELITNATRQYQGTLAEHYAIKESISIVQRALNPVAKQKYKHVPGAIETIGRATGALKLNADDHNRILGALIQLSDEVLKDNDYNRIFKRVIELQGGDADPKAEDEDEGTEDNEADDSAPRPNKRESDNAKRGKTRSKPRSR